MAVVRRAADNQVSSEVAAVPEISSFHSIHFVDEGDEL
jgi:hypothetical protein